MIVSDALAASIWPWDYEHKWLLILTGYLIGGDVLRLLHGHMDECLTVPSGEHGEEQRRSVPKPGVVYKLWFAGERIILMLQKGTHNQTEDNLARHFPFVKMVCQNLDLLASMLGRMTSVFQHWSRLRLCLIPLVSACLHSWLIGTKRKVRWGRVKETLAHVGLTTFDRKKCFPQTEPFSFLCCDRIFLA